ncbi:MAG: hypothetical protein R3F56_16330 [Planctomycetota bacterium]
MSLSFTLLLSTCALLPQQDPSATQPVLSKSDHDALRSKLRDYYGARADANDANEKRRAAAAKKETQARDKFLKDWDGRAEKKNALANVADLQAVFANCFEFDRQTGSGDLRAMKPKGFPPHDLVLPKKYKADAPAATVFLLRGQSDKGFVPARDWYEKTWKSAAAAGDYVFVLPELDESVDFDPPADLSKPDGQATDGKRREVLLAALGGAMRTVNVDRDRLYLDCGAGSCAYALRLCTYFPHLFAGIVLRKPTDPGDLQLDSLTGVPVLLLRSDETKDVSDRLAAALNKLQAGSATVLDAKGDYPFTESAAEVAEWMGKHSRDVFRSRVVIANNHDSMRRAYWVFMGKAEPIADVLPAERPRLEVVADRASNKITVTSRGVSDFGLWLNDALVDLDKEITCVINGKAQPPFKLERSLKRLLDNVFNLRDSSMLFVAEKGFEVPEEKPEKKVAKDGQDAGAKDGPPSPK